MLPEPSSTARAHQARLLAHIAKVCQQQNGKISFADFMTLALYAPSLGYYSAGLTKLGQDGDFITSPEISTLFSQTVGAQCQQILRLLPTETACILELGAGTGRMAADLLNFLAKQQQLPQHYYILEVSADLRARQQAYLQTHCSDYFDRITWLDRLPAEGSFTGIILGNEVIDALPCHLFKISENGTCLEGYVSMNGEIAQLSFLAPTSIGFEKAVQTLQTRLETQFAPGYTSEIHLSLPAWIASLSTCLKQGVMLFIDYGFPSHEYYHPARHMGTLMCHYRHYAHSDPLQYIGLQDITAHVDFTALAIAAIEHSLTVAGFTTQGAFLINNGITTLASAAINDTEQLAFSHMIQKLTHPHEMGELFKVIAFTKDFDEPLLGFAVFDQRHRL